MRKRGKLLTWCMMVLLGVNTITLSGKAAESGGFEYEVLEDNTIEITRYTGNATTVIIPKTLEGKIVTSIDEYAFYGCSSLISIEIPSGVESISGYVFSSCSGLEDIIVDKENPNYYSDGNCIITKGKEKELIRGCKDSVIPSDVTRIESQAFDGCSSLIGIEIPSGVESIGSEAFYGCSSLANIEIPDSVESISEGAFRGCSSLTSMKIPAGVENIVWYVFYGCSSLTSIEIPDSVTEIQDCAFEYCSSLTSIEIPDSVTVIGNSAFYGCSSLTSIEIPKSVTKIDVAAFSGCGKLEYFTVDKENPNYYSDGNCIITKNEEKRLLFGCKSSVIPSGVTSIEDYAFSGCSNLTSIEVPDSVTSVGYGAFSDCRSLTGIEIPAGVMSIGKYAFSNCERLEDITVDKENSNYYSDGNCIITKGEEKELIVGCNSSIIPIGVTSIGEGAFYACRSLTDIEIPIGVTSIGESAFRHCISLTSIEIPASVTSIGVNAFENCDNLTIYAEPDSYAADWAVANGIPTLSLTDNDSEESKPQTPLPEIPAGQTSEKPQPEENTDTLPVIGTEVVSSAGIYKVTKSTSSKKEVTYVKPKSKNKTAVSIPDTIKISGFTYKVTSVASNALANNKKVTKVTVGKNVTSIGKNAFKKCTKLKIVTLKSTSLKSIGSNAFYGDKNLKTITIKSSKLTSKSVGKNAFKGTNKKLTIKVPKKKVSSYKKFFKKKGNKKIIVKKG